MNFVICKSNRIHVAKRPIHLWTFPQLLRQIGAQEFKNNGAPYMVPRRLLHDDQFLWARFTEAKNLHRAHILKHHPDRGGSNELAARYNSIWDTLQMRFKKFGIGTKI